MSRPMKAFILVLAFVCPLTVSAHWDRVTSLPQGEALPGSKIAHDQSDRVYYYSSNNDQLYYWQISDQSWHNTATAPNSGEGFSMAYSRWGIMSLTGRTYPPLPDRECWFYELTDRWRQLTDVPMPDFSVGRCSDVCFAGTTYEMGSPRFALFYVIKGDGGAHQQHGDNSELWLNSVNLTPTRNDAPWDWSRGRGMPWGDWGEGSCIDYAARPATSEVAYGVYALKGGDDKTTTTHRFVNRMYRYDVETDSWVYLSEVPGDFAGDGKVSLGTSMAVAKSHDDEPNPADNLIYVMAGSGDPDRHWIFNTADNSWSPVDHGAHPPAEEGTCITAQENNLWGIFGGDDGLWLFLNDDDDGGQAKSKPQLALSCEATMTGTGLSFRWQQPTSSPVTLQLTDASGRVLAEPIAARAYPAGTHEVQPDGMSVSTGVVFYRLVVGDRQVSGKVCLVK